MKNEKIKSDIPRHEHPNPQWERKSFNNLNGIWQFEIDNAKSGEDRELYNKAELSGEIIVPFCPESELSGIGNHDFMLAVWYKKKLDFKECELSGKRIILHFGAADFETKLWVNGKRAGFPHIGGYGSFEYDITDSLKVGENDITIECLDDTRDPRQAGGKQSPKYNSYGCYYTRTTGIWQTVWYEAVPENYIRYAKILPDLENESVMIDASLCGKGDFSAEVYYDGRPVGFTEKRNLSVTGQLEIKLTEKHIWELGCGRLYDLILKFDNDEVKSYFGLRSIALDGMKFKLNGKSTFQRLILDQGFYSDGIYTAPSDEELIRDIECSMSAGFNGARLHEKVFEPRFLYHADRLGYMVWGEYGNWGIDTSDISNLSVYLPDWLSVVRRDINHPSVIGWCPFNETWDNRPQFSRQDNDFLRIIYEQTKLTDPTRPCIDTSGLFHVVTDIYDIHDYEQEPQIFRSHFEGALEKGEIIETNSYGRQKWNGTLPLFVSEFGGTGFCMSNNDEKRENAWSYGKSTLSYEEFYERYRGLAHAILDNPAFMGFCYTQLTDIEQEQNGLFSYEGRKPKFDVNILKEINSKKAAIED
jgi:beta-galactosidase/beta-glucuronidase